MQQLLPAQPVEQIGAIGGVENLLQGVALLQSFDIAGDGQQVQVMVAQHAGQRIAHLVEKAQGGE
ncbi:hypothetical protein D3C86_1829500 [compost metagenome]